MKLVAGSGKSCLSASMGSAGWGSQARAEVVAVPDASRSKVVLRAASISVTVCSGRVKELFRPCDVRPHLRLD